MRDYGRHMDTSVGRRSPSCAPESRRPERGEPRALDPERRCRGEVRSPDASAHGLRVERRASDRRQLRPICSSSSMRSTGSTRPLGVQVRDLRGQPHPRSPSSTSCARSTGRHDRCARTHRGRDRHLEARPSVRRIADDAEIVDELGVTATSVAKRGAAISMVGMWRWFSINIGGETHLGAASPLGDTIAGGTHEPVEAFELAGARVICAPRRSARRLNASAGALAHCYESRTLARDRQRARRDREPRVCQIHRKAIVERCLAGGTTSERRSAQRVAVRTRSHRRRVAVDRVAPIG